MRKTKLTLLLFAALLAGVCIGFYVNDAIIRARVRRYSQIPANLADHISEKLAAGLDLNPIQQEQIRLLALAYEERFQDARERSRALRHEVTDDLLEQIQILLTPEQQAAYDDMMERMEARHRETRALRRAMRSDSKTNSTP